MVQRFRAIAPLAVIAAFALVLTACSSSKSDGGSSSSGAVANGAPLKVGMLTSFTGPLAVISANYANGFDAGLDYYTKGTGIVNGHKIVVTKGDDTGDVAVGTSLAKTMIGDGNKFLIGAGNSSVALSTAALAVQNKVVFLGGNLGTTELVTYDKLVFTMNNTSPAGQYALKQLIVSATNGSTQGKTMADIQQDYAFGQNQAASLKTLVQPLGITVTDYMLPQTTTDFTAAVLKIKQTKPDILTAGWSAGAGQAALYGSLASQGVLSQSKYVGQISTLTSWPSIGSAFGSSIGDVTFFMTYFEGATSNPEATALSAYSKAHSHVVDAGDAVGWYGAAAIVHAIQVAGVDDTAKMAAAISGYSFEGPAGQVNIRAEDNLLISPAFSLHLKQTGATWNAELVKAYSAADITPPVVKAFSK